MTDAISEDDVPARRGRPVLVMMLPAILAGLGAFGAGYAGFISPLDLISPRAEAVQETPQVVFVDVPRIVVPMAGRERQLILSVKLDVQPEKAAEVRMLMPRVLDSFTGFLSAIDPAAIDRRGVLDIIRGELRARVDMIFGADVINQLLITEFAVQ
ncbi:flagellar basal body-associated FliL family protein [Paracoccus sediminicola]|uniref:flagellar basal body-associated FliL family protein n=1 Tax=Paracoccus sediminicola TaxID=3017783 RepID=UPI0022F07F73|nr:flagellar basal body-associated FliL family protein [Paracoccus sediminicola]WBU56726.1 flagellar basal body-associated FliL family protein [Paracoccus sediminicola]